MAVAVQQLFRAIVSLKCPVCLDGPVFKDRFNAHQKCPRCGFYFSRESGFWAGSTYFGYAATVVVAGTVGLLMGFAFGMGWTLPVLAAVIAAAVVFPLWFFPYARAIWLALDLYLNPPVTEDFEERGRDTPA